MTRTTTAYVGSLRGQPAANIDTVIGPKLKDKLAPVLHEPLPPTLLLAAANLTMPERINRSKHFLKLATNPWFAAAIPPIVIAIGIIIYVAKSLVGIDLFDEHSLLHFLISD